MTRLRDKNVERHYAEFCARALGVAWKIVEEGEAPDFVVTEGTTRFGLEVTQAFMDSARVEGGSEVRRREGKAQKSMDRIRREYLKQTGATISVTFMTRPSQADEQEIANRLISLGLHDQPIGAFAETHCPNGQRIVARRTPSQLWRVVADSAGWVDQHGHVQLQHCIAQKAPVVRPYRAGLQDLRLLVVADSMLNSGKLIVRSDAVIELMGFTHVYFAKYPKDVIAFPMATRTV